MHALKAVLNSTLQLIGRHVKGFYAAIAAFFTIGFLFATAAVSVFAGMASAVSAGLTQSFDEAVLRWFEQHRTPLMNKVMLEITTLGTGIVLIMIVLVASLFLWQTQHKWSVYVLLIGSAGADLMNALLKGFYDRPRPSVVEWADHVASPSFPSGHAMASFVTYGSVAYLLGRLEPEAKSKKTTWVLAAIIVLAIGISRMYLGVHYPSDVIAGFIAGLAWLAFVASAVTGVQFFAPRRPETREEEHDLEK